MELFKSRPRVVYTNAVWDKVYPVIVDIKRGIKSTEEIQFVSSDVNTGILSVAFIQGNDNYNVTGAEVVCSVMRPDASTLELPCEVVGENIVEVPLGINGTSQDGIYSFDFKVFKGENKVVGTPIMNYSVSLSISNDMVVEEDDRLPVLTMLMTQVTELKDEAREVINQANTATEATKVATANAIEATNNVNVTINTANQKMLEVDNAKNEMATTVSNKIDEVENRFNALTSSQQQDAEVIDARDGETSLKARLDRDIEKAKQVYVNVEGSHISTDSSSGYLKDVEIKGNTIQDASNLADIRSVGDKVEGQELYKIPVLSCGKNLFNSKDADVVLGKLLMDTGKFNTSDGMGVTGYIPVKAGQTLVCSGGVDAWYGGFYDTNKVWKKAIQTLKVIFDEDGYYRVSFRINDISTAQIEFGNTATEYEPYQEDKITILSPVQLEKVGDVADRIIEKDGVWGVEKNIKTKNINTNIFSKRDLTNENYARWCKPNAGEFMDCILNAEINGYCDKYEVIRDLDSRNLEKLSVCLLGGTDDYRIMLITPSEIDNVAKLNDYVSSNPFLVKYPTTQPTFIPLPHDQQIKLRTFANKTNISFLTEIEGTIKAQVPKSLGATVNTHTTQISNLNKELDRVKKLEESTVSTVETESDFTTVEQTSNGYFEDVKLEGKTLVNLWDISKMRKASSISVADNYVTVNADGSWIDCHPVYTAGAVPMLKPNTEYTVIAHIKNNTLDSYMSLNVDNSNRSPFTRNVILEQGFTGYYICKLNTKADLSMIDTSLRCQIGSQCTTGTVIFNCILLEGDHTQNPPSYFEGLKSVGQDVNEIVVSSVKGDGNLFDDTSISLNKFLTTEGNLTNIDGWFVSDYIKITGDCYIQGLINIASSGLSRICVYDKNKKFKRLLTQPLNTILNISQYVENNDYIRITEKIEQAKNIIVCKTTLLNSQHQSDKKRLLFYNNETQTWEKPILREWDSIEKHSDGKYYYHQRSGEVVLNGSENWKSDKNSSTISPPAYRQSIMFNSINIPNSTFDTKISSNLISDLLPSVRFSNIYNSNHIGISIYGTDNIGTHIVINNGFENATELKQWLQTNNITVVYQLAEEKVYECTNIDLITYANETNYIVESGAIVPRSTLKVHNNISNVVSLLQKKVSLLESNVKASQEVQDMMILETDMRMLDIELALMEFAPMKLNLGGSDMLRSATYFNFVKNHIINETYEKEYLENVMNKYLATGRINQDEYDELYKMLYPPVYDIELPIEP